MNRKRNQKNPGQGRFRDFKGRLATNVRASSAKAPEHLAEGWRPGSPPPKRKTTVAGQRRNLTGFAFTRDRVGSIPGTLCLFYSILKVATAGIISAPGDQRQQAAGSQA